MFGGTESEQEHSTMSDPDMYTILSNPRRYAVLSYLAKEGGPVDFETLLGVVAAEEAGVPVNELSRKQERRVYVALHQNHLPYLESEGLITWDKAQSVVQISKFADIDLYLSQSHRAHQSYQLPLVLSICSLALVALYLLADGVIGVFSMLLMFSVLATIAAALTYRREQQR